MSSFKSSVFFRDNIFLEDVGSAPSAPPAGEVRLYAIGKKIKIKNEDNIELEIGAIPELNNENKLSVGNNILQNVNSGVNGNLGFGNNSGSSIMSNGNNIILGENSVNALANGEYNVFIGNNVADTITTTDDSILIGHGIASNSSGLGNDLIIIGKDSGLDLGLSANGNICLGNNSLNSANNPSHSVIIGDSSGQSINNGSFNVIIGDSSGNGLIDGNHNLFLGTNVAMASDFSGLDYQLVIGDGSDQLFRANMSDANLAIGHTSGPEPSFRSGTHILQISEGTSPNSLAVSGTANIYLSGGYLRYNNDLRNILIGISTYQVKAKTVSNLPSIMSQNGNTIVGNSVSLGNIDGITINDNDLIFVDENASNVLAHYRGIYIVTQSSSPYTLTRWTEADTIEKFEPGTLIQIKEGNTFGGSLFSHSTQGGASITFNTTPLEFTNVSSVGFGINDLTDAKNDPDDNLSFGSGALSSVVSGSSQGNISVGKDAGNNITTGGDNIIIGQNSGQSLVDGSGNIVIGPGVDVDNSDDIGMFHVGNSTHKLLRGDIIGGKFAIGNRSEINLRGQTTFSHFSFDGITKGQCQRSNLLLVGVSTSASIITLTTDTNPQSGTDNVYEVRDYALVHITATVTAKIGGTTNVNDTATWKIDGAIHNNGTNVELITIPQKISLKGNNTTTWDVDLTVDNVNKAFRLDCTGHPSSSVYWVANVEVTQNYTP